MRKYRDDEELYRLGGGEGGGTYKYTDDIRLYRLGGDQETCQYRVDVRLYKLGGVIRERASTGLM
jgi:hypothetical protein